MLLNVCVPVICNPLQENMTMTWWLLVVVQEALHVPKKVSYNCIMCFHSLVILYIVCVTIVTYKSALTAALVGQNVAVLDYVEPSIKGKKESSLVFFTK